MKRKRFTEEEIIGILKESDWGHIHALKRHGDPQAVLQRIASIVPEMRPNLMLDSGETITGTRPGWSKPTQGQEQLRHLYRVFRRSADCSHGG